MAMENIEWVSMNLDGDLPPLAVAGGHDIDGDRILVGRARHGDGAFMPAWVVPNKRKAYMHLNGESIEIAVDDMELICGDNWNWRPLQDVSREGKWKNACYIGNNVYVGRATRTIDPTEAPRVLCIMSVQSDIDANVEVLVQEG